MQLSPGERSILAYFPSSGAAQKAAESLKQSGIETARVDRVSRYGAKSDEHYNNPINRAVTGTGPTLFSDGAGGDQGASERVLLAADPSVSGYGGTDYGVAGGKAFLLTVVTTDDRIEGAVELIKQNGGMV